MWLIPYEIIIVISKQKASLNYGLARAFSRQLDESYYVVARRLSKGSQQHFVCLDDPPRQGTLSTSVKRLTIMKAYKSAPENSGVLL